MSLQARFEFRLTRSIDVSVALTITKPAVNEPATTIKRKIPLEVVRHTQVYVTGISELLLNPLAYYPVYYSFSL